MLKVLSHTFCILGLCVFLTLTGCSQLTVVTDAYRDDRLVFSPQAGQSIFIVSAKEGQRDRLLNRQIQRSIEIALKEQSWRVVDDQMDAQYVLNFLYQRSRGQRVTEFREIRRGGRTRRVYDKDGQVIAEYETPHRIDYTPYTYREYTHTLQLILKKAYQSDPLWQAESFVRNDTSDSRKIYPYLIKAAFQYFGLDTQYQVRDRIRLDNDD